MFNCLGSLLILRTAGVDRVSKLIWNETDEDDDSLEESDPLLEQVEKSGINDAIPENDSTIDDSQLHIGELSQKCEGLTNDPEPMVSSEGTGGLSPMTSAMMRVQHEMDALAKTRKKNMVEMQMTTQSFQEGAKHIRGQKLHSMLTSLEGSSCGQIYKSRGIVSVA